MQEEIEQKTVTLAINTTKLTGRVLNDAISKLLRHMENSQSKEVIPRGKQTVKQLIGQNQGVTNIEITDSGIKDFERVARKYGVDYAVKKDRSGDNPRYLVFFKARDNDALTAAFQEYTAKQIQKEKKPSVIEKLRAFAAQISNPVHERTKEKELER